ncbi:unnamed protein product [Vitrella brassicaformis CCMP3155]|uniref:Uncharacterized protein n=1 Tax=Vitrella brassicaformis (strain CCMP3155) TaxID=1169540 RepID=A0A0G4GSL8_VITBC|nr:unnamed protein product [Vitrella brassicaformis CCMP3155]|eukprot:CEM33562.1 unnamed protein product [Vitrella brassicaformis CCMP3155]
MVLAACGPHADDVPLSSIAIPFSECFFIKQDYAAEHQNAAMQSSIRCSSLSFYVDLGNGDSTEPGGASSWWACASESEQGPSGGSYGSYGETLTVSTLSQRDHTHSHSHRHRLPHCPPPPYPLPGPPAPLPVLPYVAEMPEHLRLLAFRSGDVGLCERFCALCGMATDISYRQTLKTLKLLHRCQYRTKDIVHVMALASCYLEECSAQLSVGDPSERAYECVLLIYLAHCWLLDRACPIKIWHEHLTVRSYSSLSAFRNAMVRLWQLQSFRLCFDREPVVARAEFIQGTDSHRHYD